MVPQRCRPQTNGLALAAAIRTAQRGIDGYWNLSVETMGNGFQAVRSDPTRHAAETYAMTGRDAEIAGKSRFANLTTIWLEARSVLRIRK